MQERHSELRSRLVGCYITIPTMFSDPDLELDQSAMERHIEFLIEGGVSEGNAVVLSGGGAGDFSTMDLSERLQVAETVVNAIRGRVPVTVGSQTTNTRELVTIVKKACALGADYVQISPPFYFAHTEDDFLEYVQAAAESAPDLGIIVYNTYWTSAGVTSSIIERLAEMPSVVGLKWSSAESVFMEFESVVAQFSDRFSIIDNQCRFPVSHMLGARSIELHICNHWPQWGIRLWKMLEEQRYKEVQLDMMKVLLPYMETWAEIERYTSGDGYMDKLCMELVGLDSSRCRPPTRDVRAPFREKVRQMLLDCGTPGVE